MEQSEVYEEDNYEDDSHIEDQEEKLDGKKVVDVQDDVDSQLDEYADDMKEQDLEEDDEIEDDDEEDEEDEDDYEDDIPQPGSDIGDSLVDSSNRKESGSGSGIGSGKPDTIENEDEEVVVMDEPIEVETMDNIMSTAQDNQTKKKKSSTDSLNGKFREELGSQVLQSGSEIASGAPGNMSDD